MYGYNYRKTCLKGHHMKQLPVIFLFIYLFIYFYLFIFHFYLFFFFICVLRPFQEYFTYIEPIVHQRQAKTEDPREKPSDHP